MQAQSGKQNLQAGDKSMPGSPETNIDWKRIVFILLGLGIFLFIYFLPPWQDANDVLNLHFSMAILYIYYLKLIQACC